MNNIISGIELAPVITIDGPSGVGKGAVSRWLARKLHWHRLDSGLLYRLVAFLVVSEHIDIYDVARIVNAAIELKVHFEEDEQQNECVWLADQEVSKQVRDEGIGKVASCIAAYPEVRQALLARQRDFCHFPGLIADGRDMGTCVFPEAKIKFFLDATLDKRAERRQKQLLKNGIRTRLSDILVNVRARDQRDRRREISPLKPAIDAIIIDTSSLKLTEVQQRIYGEIRRNKVLAFMP